MVSKQGSNVKVSDVGKQETQDVFESMWRRERRTVRKGGREEYMQSQKSPRGRVDRLDVRESWCEAKGQKMLVKWE